MSSNILEISGNHAKRKALEKEVIHLSEENERFIKALAGRFRLRKGRTSQDIDNALKEYRGKLY